MLARYTIYEPYRKRPLSDPLPDGKRKDTRAHRRHCLSPTKEMVQEYLASPTPKAWREYEAKYRALLKNNFRMDRRPFDKLAALAMDEDVFLGCSCPTKANPDPKRCHTVLALRFMKTKYPKLKVQMP